MVGSDGGWWVSGLRKGVWVREGRLRRGLGGGRVMSIRRKKERMKERKKEHFRCDFVVVGSVWMDRTGLDWTGCLMCFLFTCLLVLR